MKVSKAAVVSMLALASSLSSQQVASVMNSAGSFRKDIILAVKSGQYDTHIPVTVIKGKEKGPVFTMVAGIHGYEYPPVIAVQELLKEISSDSVRGTLIIIPIANIEAFNKRTPFISPLDNKNLNNAFPGSPEGTPTDLIAHLITKEVISNSDVFLDIHGGDANEDLIPFVCYYNRTDTPEQTAAAYELSVKSQIPYIISYPYTITASEPAKYAFKQAVQQGITALSIEAGKLGNVQEDQVALIKNAVYRMLEHTGNYITSKKTKKETSKAILLNRQEYIRVPQSGIFYSSFKSGDTIKKGEVLGFITDEFGHRKQDIIATSDGIILYKIGTPPVNQGETLFCIGYHQ
ncbi:MULTISPECIES: succinylglutamate desuccinylase/aspartoacylase family protein [Chryseobacterium]|uniref:Deacylase n=1 Tax=Chryseobacterium camelliae TaxID=1265445 RepID=A0ABU0TF49_9FLAO|nr:MULTISPECIES: M14 family metallopeptidase [Chryseobacterium]MDT3406510.1 putative deacylase [Pseudacidovorax intermedius]MDQ1095692.1 putative deacylase [Chryseobacterium camelliae]MDQ1099628.1 putative deacylase [Chryseobacterium sp. SORGH_AS_1048]MDR6086977.1 putative deacylase [Chryseobacterium sp. SORGH_AS_0909]MDR6131348.1 putative deacylase [Chryseobacterium sp. SORGH_AS_1175]